MIIIDRGKRPRWRGNFALGQLIYLTESLTCNIVLSYLLDLVSNTIVWNYGPSPAFSSTAPAGKITPNAATKMTPTRHSALPRNNTDPTTNTSKDAHEAVIKVSESVIYSTILPHTAEAGDPYYIGDAYSEYPLDISREWEINRLVDPLVFSLVTNLKENKKMDYWIVS